MVTFVSNDAPLHTVPLKLVTQPMVSRLTKGTKPPAAPPRFLAGQVPTAPFTSLLLDFIKVWP